MNKNLKTITDKSLRGHRSGGGDFFKFQPNTLHLSDGTSFQGYSPVWQDNSISGEVVFNTGMTGYVESLTDPSYTGQILVFTYPLIGNYGVDSNSYESEKIQVRGVIMGNLYSSEKTNLSRKTLLQWLNEQYVPILTNIDTRSITKHLRSKGTMMGTIGQKYSADLNVKASCIKNNKPIKLQVYNHGGSKKIILVDCGAKENIIRMLVGQGLNVHRVSANYDYSNETYDGVVLSNGPGDPTDYTETIAVTKKAMKLKKPIFGICLGSQIMALAADARTYKLKFGHRGHNQPCLEIKTNKCFMTSQNHGFAIDEVSLSKSWNVSFRNLNDASIEGIQHRTLPFFSVQFHPEACPGPEDTAWLFSSFYQTV